MRLSSCETARESRDGGGAGEGCPSLELRLDNVRHDQHQQARDYRHAVQEVCGGWEPTKGLLLHAKAQRNHDLNIRESRYHKMRYQFCGELFVIHLDTEHAKISKAGGRVLQRGEHM